MNVIRLVLALFILILVAACAENVTRESPPDTEEAVDIATADEKVSDEEIRAILEKVREHPTEELHDRLEALIKVVHHKKPLQSALKRKERAGDPSPILGAG